jgi:hypothetical protein
MMLTKKTIELWRTPSNYMHRHALLKSEWQELCDLATRALDMEFKVCRHGWRGSVPERGEQIVTPCPACGAKSLFIGSGGHLTCARVPSDHGGGCDDPSVEDAINHLKDRLRAAEEDAARWNCCQRVGFPVRNQTAANPDVRWTIDGKWYGATPTHCVDAALAAQADRPAERE